MNRAPKKQQRGFSLVELVIVVSLLSLLAIMVGMNYDDSKSKGQVLVSSMNEFGNGLLRFKVDVGCYPTSLVALYNETQADGAGNFCNQTVTGGRWNGPYVARFTAAAGGAAGGAGAAACGSGGSNPALMDQIAAGLAVSLDCDDSAVPGKRQWFIHAVNVPRDIAIQAMRTCNGNLDGGAGSGASSGGGAAGSGATDGSGGVVSDPGIVSSSVGRLQPMDASGGGATYPADFSASKCRSVDLGGGQGATATVDMIFDETRT